MSNASTQTCLAPLLAWYASLSPDTVGQVSHWYHPDARFRDPFNTVKGHAAIEAIFTHMFHTTVNPRFEISNQLASGQQAFVTWRFLFELKGKAYQIEGGSHLFFGEDGRVIDHRDYWDAAEELFEKLPIVGAPIRWLRRQFKLPSTD
ncbi:nuclear transport factor 2 family protein [Leeia sp. TBRC 13508]|uniref:Nuclear transport factor 2 family protein n=1 Tax=Leeia speluncae TaxID=2884804 RepID=A0ABS8D716_9NEIS|nr:nuclear transport factor 2 family protein [Leeia speluncae]MCB6183967.1 nuclear transport factor 2 family protein [Leeia speluncae]